MSAATTAAPSLTAAKRTTTGILRRSRRRERRRARTVRHCLARRDRRSADGGVQPRSTSSAWSRVGEFVERPS